MCNTNGPSEEEIAHALTSYAIATDKIKTRLSQPPTENQRDALLGLYEEARAWVADYGNGEVPGADREQYEHMLNEAAALLRAYVAAGGDINNA